MQSNKEISNETERYVNHRISPLDPLHDVSPDGRHRPVNGARNAFKPDCAAHSCRPAVRNAGAGRKAIWVRLIFLGSLLLLVVPVIHMKGAGVGGAIAKSNGTFFFICTLLAIGVTALFSVILSARGLWEHLPSRTTAQHKQGAPE